MPLPFKLPCSASGKRIGEGGGDDFWVNLLTSEVPDQGSYGRAGFGGVCGGGVHFVFVLGVVINTKEVNKGG